MKTAVIAVIVTGGDPGPGIVASVAAAAPDQGPATGVIETEIANADAPGRVIETGIAADLDHVIATARGGAPDRGPGIDRVAKTGSVSEIVVREARTRATSGTRFVSRMSPRTASTVIIRIAMLTTTTPSATLKSSMKKKIENLWVW